MTKSRYSVIVPVYNRPQEVDELLDSLTKQTFRDFEVLLVEDGSSLTCEKVFEKYVNKLTLHYFFKPNSGPGPSRNFGFERAQGDYLVIFDSDCIIPPTYFEAVEKFRSHTQFDTWGGPDRGHESFSPVQRAMGYTMSSVLTTGGIRGGKQKGFQPRSFNMGMRKEVFKTTGGFKFDRFAEDIEFSVRIRKAGFISTLIPDAFVYHKRRTNFSQFYKQVFNFGRGRVLVSRVHRGEIKITHWFPSLFLLGGIFSFTLFFLKPVLASILLAGYAIYFLAIGVHSFLVNKSIEVSLLSIPSAAVQLLGYGTGFLREKIKRLP